jgi:hypothetical protein
MSEERSILENLQYIATQQRTVTLISNFRGVPIQLVAFVIRSSQNGGVRLCINHRQMIALKVADQTLVQSDLFSEMVIADIDQVDLHTNIVTLSNLQYVTDSRGKRKNVRVQPESPIHAEIIANHGFNLLGEVIDISLDGLSVRLSDNNLGLSIQLSDSSLKIADLLKPQTSVEVRLGLPGSEQDLIHDLTIEAKIAYVNANRNAYRIGLMTYLHEIQQMNHSLLQAV